jgi:hypothetical protein
MGAHREPETKCRLPPWPANCRGLNFKLGFEVKISASGTVFEAGSDDGELDGELALNKQGSCLTKMTSKIMDIYGLKMTAVGGRRTGGCITRANLAGSTWQLPCLRAFRIFRSYTFGNRVTLSSPCFKVQDWSNLKGHLLESVPSNPSPFISVDNSNSEPNF